MVSIALGMVISTVVMTLAQHVEMEEEKTVNTVMMATMLMAMVAAISVP